MKNLINNLNEGDAKKILVDFMDVYLGKGFGMMNKTDIETLMFHVLKKHGLLSGKCFDDSLKLQITEAKARKLLYEGEIKYETRNKDELLLYLRTKIGECLQNAYFSKNRKEIRFAIEDKYLRVALNAKLRENNFFADTSFNKDIVSLDEKAFQKMVLLLVPNFQRDEVLSRLTAIQLEENSNEINEFISAFIKEAIVQCSVEGLKQIGMLLKGTVTATI